MLADRRILVRFGLRIKERLGEIGRIASPETLLAWNRRLKKSKWTFDTTPRKVGRPRKDPTAESLVVRLAEENGAWGYRRTAGESRKLGHLVSPSFVHDDFRRHGFPTAPNRKGITWKQFIQAHLDVTWAADFFTEEVWTLGGLVSFYVLFFIHLGSRRVFVAGCTPYPNGDWMRQQARNVSMFLRDSGLPCRYLIHVNANPVSAGS